MKPRSLLRYPGGFCYLQRGRLQSPNPVLLVFFLNAFVPMIPAVTAFFDHVMVMAEDEKLQKNRLGLLQRIAALAEGAADLSRMEGF